MGRALKMIKPMGDPYEDLALVEEEKPSPGPGEVLVRLKLRTVNPSDLLVVRMGSLALVKITPAVYTPTPGANGVIPGAEGYGVVEEVGEGVQKFKPGQRVVPVLVAEYLETGMVNGSWQDYLVMEEDDVFSIPDSMDDDTAAQFVTNPWSAYGLLESLAAPGGEYIISTAAGSALARVVIQLAKHWGLKTINIVRHDGYTEELKALGADVVINSSKEDMVAEVMELTNGKGAFGAVDAVGGMLTKTVAKCVRDKGEVWMYGFLGGFDVTIGALDIARLVQLKWYNLYTTTDTLAKRKAIAAELLRLFEEKVLAPMPSTNKFKFEDWKSAIIAAENHGGGGNKVLLAD